MRLVIVNQMRKGRICPHLSKTSPLKLKHKTSSTLTWAITTWPMTTLRRKGILIILSATMPELFRMFLMLPYQRQCVLTSRYRIRISNHTLHHLQRRLTHLTTKFSRPQQDAQPSSMNCLTRSLFRVFSMGESLKSFGNSHFST
jgi:hypothetical protein